MSIHAEISLEARTKLARERRNSTILSFVVSIMSILLVSLILGFFLLPNLTKDVPVIVTYASNTVEETPIETKKVVNQVSRKPSSPSSSMAKVIAANTVSNVSIPVPEDVTEVESVEFGDGTDFGTGWGDSDTGVSGGGASAKFFNQEVKVGRVAYVIDYSKSMGGKREELMRKELSKSINSLGEGIQYQLIFFSRTPWVAGSTKEDDSSTRALYKTLDGKKHKWFKDKGTWIPDGGMHRPEWLNATAENIKQSVGIINETPLSLGTEWKNPLLMALEMKPLPEIIYFMTDGTVHGTDMAALTKEVGTLAKRKKVIINTTAMMVPKAEEHMASLAEYAAGQFTVIEEDGRARSGRSK